MVDKIKCEITEVDDVNKCVVVKYTATGFEPVMASVPFPTEDEAKALDDYLLAYSPAIAWDRESEPKATIAVNQVIEIDYAALKSAEPTASNELQELEAALANRSVGTISATAA